MTLCLARNAARSWRRCGRYLEPVVRSRRYRQAEPDISIHRLPIVPAHGEDMLWSAESVAVLGQYQPQLTPDELEFFMKYLVTLDSVWIDDALSDSTSSPSRVIRPMLTYLQLDRPISAADLIKRGRRPDLRPTGPGRRWHPARSRSGKVEYTHRCCLQVQVRRLQGGGAPTRGFLADVRWGNRSVTS